MTEDYQSAHRVNVNPAQADGSHGHGRSGCIASGPARVSILTISAEGRSWQYLNLFLPAANGGKRGAHVCIPGELIHEAIEKGLQTSKAGPEQRAFWHSVVALAIGAPTTKEERETILDFAREKRNLCERGKP